MHRKVSVYAYFSMLCFIHRRFRLRLDLASVQFLYCTLEEDVFEV
ncbi:hypothetical protein AMI01nite_05150 [Aneurinibacillus migulanus]|nr:hypothetical protein AMI01nite_05150 [Aneurinibacillus migulanus]